MKARVTIEYELDWPSGLVAAIFAVAALGPPPAAALVIACPDLGRWERIGDHLRNMQKDPLVIPVITGRSIEAMAKEGCTVIDRRGAYEIRDQDGHIRYQCMFRLDICRWIKVD
jgi:hypothetical protein